MLLKRQKREKENIKFFLLTFIALYVTSFAVQKVYSATEGESDP